VSFLKSLEAQLTVLKYSVPTSQKNSGVPVTKTSGLMQFREIIGVFPDSYTRRRHGVGKIKISL
jgi:hypothetical protein